MAGSGKLDGKVAIVTGSGRRLGRGIALALAGEGASVVVCGRTLEPLEETAAEIARRGGKSMTRVCDVTLREQVDALVQATVDQLGGIDILVNNAQASHGIGPLLDVPEEVFEAGFRSGPLATFRLMRACYPHLRGHGVIVNIGTGAAVRPDPVGYGCYGAVKEAIRTLSRAAAVEWGRDGIRVHTILPLAELEPWEAQFPEEAAEFKKRVPLQRWGDSERDIGRAVAFLCGPDSRYMTGNTLCIDGGQAYLR